MGSYQDAAYWFSKALELAEYYTDEDVLFNIRSKLALTYLKINDLDRSKEYLNLNELNYEMLPTLLKALHNNYKALILLKNENSENRRIYLNESIKLSKKINNYRFISSAMANVAISIFQEEGDVALSKTYFDSSYYYAELSNNIGKIAFAKYNLGSYYFALNALDSAIFYFNASYSDYLRANQLKEAADALEELIEIYKSKNHWSKVDELYLMSLDLKDKQYLQLRDVYEQMEITDELLHQNILSLSKDRDNLELKKNQPFYKVFKDSFPWWMMFLQSALILILLLKIAKLRRKNH
jgi:tetratricopeptide (TPR) repeat protein